MKHTANRGVLVKVCRRIAPMLVCGLIGGCAVDPTAPSDAIEDGPLPIRLGLFLEGGLPGESTSVPDALDPSSSRGAVDASDGLLETDGEALEPGADGVEAERPAPADTILASSPRDGQMRFRATREEVLVAWARAIEDAGAADRVEVLDAEERPAAIEAARKAHCDALVALRFETRERYDEYERSGGWATLEVVSWLFGGIPAWFVPTVSFPTGSRLAASGVDLSSPGLRAWSPSAASAAGAAGIVPAFDWDLEASSPARGESLWDRAHPFDRPTDYLLTILVPPMVFAPGDPERASRAVTIDTLAELGGTLGEGVRGRLLEEDARSPLGVIFLAPAAGTVAGETVKVRLGISSRDGANIAALDVHRLSPGATPVRWKASEAEVAEISRQIALLADKARYAVFELPSEIALEPGDNILKVRVLRSDRKLVTRSVACVRE